MSTVIIAYLGGIRGEGKRIRRRSSGYGGQAPDV